MFVNMALFAFKLIAGIVGRSGAMIADAIHSASDFATDIVVLAFVRISSKPRDDDHKWGHGKYETLASLIIGLALFGVGVEILIDSGEKIKAVAEGAILPRPGFIAIVAAIVSIVTKELLYQYSTRKGKALESPSVVANAWHHRSDALSSIGTFIGIGGAICLGEQWRILDPLAAIIVSFFIIKVSFQLLKPCIDELLERSLPAEIENKILAIILSFPEVSSPHHLRTRRIGNHIAIEVHIRMNGKTPLQEAHSLTTQIEKRLKEEFGKDTHIGIHMEPIK